MRKESLINKSEITLGYYVERNFKLENENGETLDSYRNVIDFKANRQWNQSSGYYKSIIEYVSIKYAKLLAEKFELFFDYEYSKLDKYLSDGHSSFLVIICEIIYCRKVFGEDIKLNLIIDTIELYLHVNQQEKIIQFIIQHFNVDIIASTHSVMSFNKINQDI